MRKAFAAHAPAQKHVLEYGNACFRLRAPPLQPLEFPTAASFPESVDIARTHRVVDAIARQPGAIGFAVKSTVSRHGLKHLAVGFFHSPDAAGQQLRIGRGALPEQLPVYDQTLPVLGQQQGVAKLHLRAGLLAHDDVNVSLVKAEDLFLIGDCALWENALASLLASLGQLLQYLVHAPEHLLGLWPRPLCLFPLLVQQLAVALGMAAHSAGEAIHLAEGFL